MTDKQIIIDEFNASEYAKTAFELAKETLAEKDQLREYYDKLLQRKEQECEELKEKINSYICSDNCYRNKKLKQTLAEIKEIITTALEQNTLINLDKILQKINEVKE